MPSISIPHPPFRPFAGVTAPPPAAASPHGALLELALARGRPLYTPCCAMNELEHRRRSGIADGAAIRWAGAARRVTRRRGVRRG